MAHVVFTENLQRHVACPPVEAAGSTLREVLDRALSHGLRPYVLDDQHAMRNHIAIFIDGVPVRDRQRLSDPVSPDAEVYVMQALSGG